MSSDLSFPLSFGLEVLFPIPTQPPSELILLTEPRSVNKSPRVTDILLAF